jgi:hypothetical protein
VPTFACGLLRSNFSLAIGVSPGADVVQGGHWGEHRRRRRSNGSDVTA